MAYLLLVLSFFLGSIPFGYLVGKLKGVDVRNYGSGNIGATNVSRVLGKKWGLLVLFLDALKGVLAVFLAKVFSLPQEFQIAAGVLAVAGHCFSPWLKFKGGKGVATALGAFLVISPKITLLSLIIFLAVFFSTRYVSLSSITAALSYPILFKFIERPSSLSFILISLGALLIVFKHRSNIERLLKGEEKKFF